MATALIILAVAIFISYSVLEHLRTKSDRGLSVEQEEAQRHRLAAVMDTWRRRD